MSTVQASPTKRFFVEMLTRDIELEDAILDLLDNCLDGALRIQHTTNHLRKYEGFYAEITVSGSEFLMTDNCGGIPLEIAQRYAFRMGRGVSDERDLELETVGMYGIGMKRAFFKLGQETLVTSRHPQAAFTVHIPPNWLEDDDNWTFELTEERIQDNDKHGTEILIRKLSPGIAAILSDPQFEVKLRQRISEHYSVVLDAGFSITVNGVSVYPTITRILFSPDGPKPYMFQYQYRSVDVFMAVGLNAPAYHDDEDAAQITAEISGPISQKREYEDGGWTIFCNDRAILVRDKSRVTGWGERVPAYHWQFAVISGVVEFRAKNATDLPVTTTKRNMDTSNELFLQVRSEMITGLKVFTDYTNAWRHERRGKQDKYFAETQPLDVSGLKRAFTNLSTRSFKRRGELSGAAFYNPHADLPSAPSQTKSARRIAFNRDIEEIREVSEYLFSDPACPPKDVGVTCFERALESARRTK